MSKAKAQLDAIRERVRRDGSTIVGCDDLRILCPGYLSSADLFFRIEAIARAEGWAFTFLRDLTVEFRSYRPGERPLVVQREPA